MLQKSVFDLSMMFTMGITIFASELVQIIMCQLFLWRLRKKISICVTVFIQNDAAFSKKASVSDKTFRQEHVLQIFKLSFSEFKLAFLLNFIGFHRFSSLNKVFVLGFLFIQCVPVGSSRFGVVFLLCTRIIRLIG